MKFPNGYGSVVKLSGKRRKPYAVRITTGYAVGDDRTTQKYKYLEYFEKQKDAVLYLANYNSGQKVKEHQSLQEAPTLEDVYKLWIDERERRKGLSDSLRNAYNAAFQKYVSLHKRKIRTLRLSDVQPVLDANEDMSRGTVSNMLTVIRGIYHYAMRYELVESDFTGLLIGSGKASKQIHKAFAADEISKLWELQADPVAHFALVTIYTGMRPVEPTLIGPEDIHLDDRYMIGGVKTASGRDRVIPIHHKILPIVEARKGSPCLFEPIRSDVYHKWMSDHGMDHLPHDGRHTCATLLEAAGVSLHRRKLILGHRVKDITEGTYTHVGAAELVAEIEKIDV